MDIDGVDTLYYKIIYLILVNLEVGEIRNIPPWHYKYINYLIASQIYIIMLKTKRNKIRAPIPPRASEAQY